MKLMTENEFKELEKKYILGGPDYFAWYSIYSSKYKALCTFDKRYVIEDKSKYEEDGIVYILFDNFQEKIQHDIDLSRWEILYFLKVILENEEMYDIVSKWEEINGSPYSASFYNTKNIDWGFKPEGSLRLSDHWNFESRGEKHCQLDTTEEYLSGVWILARYENGIYKEIKRF